MSEKQKTMMCPKCDEPMERCKEGEDVEGWRCLNCGKYISAYRKRLPG